MFDQVNEKYEKSEDSLAVVDFEAMEEDNFFPAAVLVIYSFIVLLSGNSYFALSAFSSWRHCC